MSSEGLSAPARHTPEEDPAVHLGGARLDDVPRARRRHQRDLRQQRAHVAEQQQHEAREHLADGEDLEADEEDVLDVRVVDDALGDERRAGGAERAAREPVHEGEAEEAGQGGRALAQQLALVLRLRRAVLCLALVQALQLDEVIMCTRRLAPGLDELTPGMLHGSGRLLHRAGRVADVFQRGSLEAQALLDGRLSTRRQTPNRRPRVSRRKYEQSRDGTQPD